MPAVWRDGDERPTGLPVGPRAERAPFVRRDGAPTFDAATMFTSGPSPDCADADDLSGVPGVRTNEVLAGTFSRLSALRENLRRAPDLSRPLIVGESNPYGSDPRFALWPDPPGCAGERLCRLVLGLDPEEYLRRFDRQNLFIGRGWSTPAARTAAALVVASGRQRLVLLGRKVQDAFGVNLAPCGVGWIGGVAYAALPHPSGRCRAWNEPGAFERARTAVTKLLGPLP